MKRESCEYSGGATAEQPGQEGIPFRNNAHHVQLISGCVCATSSGGWGFRVVPGPACGRRGAVSGRMRRRGGDGGGCRPGWLGVAYAFPTLAA